MSYYRALDGKSIVFVDADLVCREALLNAVYTCQNLVYWEKEFPCLATPYEGEWYPLSEVRDRPGITRQQEHETDRRRQRTRSAKDDRNVTWPESQTPRSHPAVAQEPRPVLHARDNRFTHRRNARQIYCDGTCSRYYTKDGSLGFDGIYVTECPGTFSMNASEKYDYQRRAYAEGTWDATWLCATCWQQKLYSDTGNWYSLPQVRDRLGITAQREHEIDRRRQRSLNTAVDDECPYPEKLTLPAHISKFSGLSTVVAGSNKGTRRKAMALGIVIAAVLERKVARRSLPRAIDSLFRSRSR